MKITIIVDNYVSKRDFLAEHGFSVLIETEEEKILFDTGQGYALKHNLELIGTNLSSINKVILSHGHDDHTGGLRFFNEEGIFPEIISHPDIRFPKFKVSETGKRNIGLKIDLSNFNNKTFSKEPLNINKDIIFSGEVPKENRWELEETQYFREEHGALKKDLFADDVSLYVKTKKGLLVLTGCAHSGIINIVNYGMKITGERRLYGILGGMHLKNASKRRIEKTVETLYDLKPEFVTISHCTGFNAGVRIREAFEEKSIFTGVGDVFKFDL